MCAGYVDELRRGEGVDGFAGSPPWSGKGRVEALKFRGRRGPALRDFGLRLKRAPQGESGSVFDNRLNVPVVKSRSGSARVILTK